jgi:mannose/cellobiose epimerase-like protein (N-acyl-D-glucosamine 2-epimerase family)
MMQVFEFAALALCCAAVAAHPRTRQMMLMVLPVLLWALWARHQFAGAPVESEEEE